MNPSRKKDVIDPTVEKRIRKALREDRARQDVTSRVLIPKSQKGKANLVTKERGILCGLDVARRCFSLLDEEVQLHARLKDGERINPGDVVATVSGSARSLLSAERVALNFLCHLSGIATLTAEFVEKTKPFHVRIYDTRKTTPLWRSLEKYAVRVGGGYNHRHDLAGATFVKDNHIDACGGMYTALERLFGKGEIKSPVIVECRDIEEVKSASKYPVDIILLDNFSLPMVKEAITIISRGCEIEISGGVDLHNVARYAKIGASRISIGAITHSAKALDMSLIYVQG